MIGKFIGAVIGSCFGGIVGFLVGVVFGHFCVDRPAEAARRRKDSFLELVCMAMAKIARADGAVSRSEIDEIESLFASLGLDADARATAIDVFTRAKDSDLTISEITATFAESFPDEYSRKAFMLILCRVAFADGNAADSELRMLEASAAILRFDLSHFINGYKRTRSQGADSAYSQPRSDSRRASDFSDGSYSSEYIEACEVLGVSTSAADAEIKSVYRKKCRELHPDLLRGKGLGEIALKALEHELSRVNDAYTTIKKYRS